MTPPLPPGIGPGRPQRGRPALVVLVLVTLLAWAPLLCVLVTAALADLLGCRVDEGSVHACPSPVGDLGELLYGLGMMGWLMLVTAPFMLGTAAAWAVLLLRWVWRLARR